MEFRGRVTRSKSKRKFSKFTIRSMDDFDEVEGRMCLYLLSERGKEWGIYGRTSDIRRRFTEYLNTERDALSLADEVTLYVTFGEYEEMKNLERNLKSKLRQSLHDHLFVGNPRGNQVEFFYNDYLYRILRMVEFL